MRKLVISIATLAALLALGSMGSAISMFSEPFFAAQKVNPDVPPSGDYSIDFESVLAQLPSR